MITKRMSKESANLLDAFIEDYALYNEGWEFTNKFKVIVDADNNRFSVIHVETNEVLFAFRIKTYYNSAQGFRYSIDVRVDKSGKCFKRTKRLIRDFGNHCLLWYWINALRWVL